MKEENTNDGSIGGGIDSTIDETNGDNSENVQRTVDNLTNDQSFVKRRIDVDLELDAIEKQGATPNVPSNTGAYSTINPSLSNYEADVLAKQRAGASRVTGMNSLRNLDIAAKEAGRSTSTAPTRPGAYSAINNVSNINPGLAEYENDIIAKQTAGSFRILNSTPQERDVASKLMGRPTNQASVKPGAYSATTAPSKNDIHPDLTNYESDILTKQSAGMSRQKTLDGNVKLTKHDGEHSAASASITQDIVAKQQGRGPSRSLASPGAYSSSVNVDLENYESDIQAKISGNKEDASRAKNQLDRDIMIKRQTSNRIRETQGAVPCQLSRLEAGAAKRAAFCPDTISGGDEATEKKDASTPSDILSDPKSADSQVKHGAERIGGKESQLNDNQNNGNDAMTKKQSMMQYGEYDGADTNGEGLAVALAVDEETTDVHLLSAVEFDPDAKPPMYRNRRFRLYLLLLFAIAVIGGVGAILGITMTQPEDAVYAPYRTTIGIRESIERVIDRVELDDLSSPYRKALDWIMFTDPMMITPESPAFFQRYILVYFYFATTKNGPWTSKCAPSETLKDDCVHEYLLEGFEGGEEGNVRKRPAFRWFSNSSECGWAGIRCDVSNQVVSVALSGSGLSGTFPEGITLLPYVHDLLLNNGFFEGTLPDSLFERSKFLQDMGIKNNLITGTIPETWYDARNLVRLSVNGNQIVGNFPSGFWKAESLREINVGSNKLTGTISSEMGSMINAQSIYANRNNISGTIPSEVRELSNLYTLDLSGNALTGKIPDAIEGMKVLEDMFLYENLITGSLPDQLWTLTNILYIRISDNLITGTISNQVSKLKELLEFVVSDNKLTGTFPSRISKKVLRIQATGNNFNGTVDLNVCNLVNGAGLTDLEFDCATPVDGGEPEISCSCCTSCCDPEGDNCVDVDP